MLSPQNIRLLFLVLFLSPACLAAQLTFELVLLPGNTPENSQFHVAGDFNDWQADNATYELLPNPSGVPSITLDLPAGTYGYKFTRGSWNTVEGNAQGGFLPNRTINYDGEPLTINVVIQSWEDQTVGSSTAAANVDILAPNFYMPQLDRYRRIWVYLPPDYESTQQDYPVLYMHDAQNLFDDATSFSGEWEVDESLNQLFEQGDDGIIVIGIENGGATRLSEYTPWSNPQYGGGEGAAYMDFIVETLKPHVDANYRTKPEREHTGIMGSSLGGLISLYGIIRHQDVFSKAGVFSPSLWFTTDIYDYVMQTGKEEDVRIYFVAGEQESATMVTDLNNMQSTLIDAGFAEQELFLLTHADGQHSEWYWAREFPAAYEWLFASITRIKNSPALAEVHLFPMPTQNVLHISGLPESASAWDLLVVDAWGRKMLSGTLDNDELDLSALTSGPYYLVLSNQEGDWGVFHLIKL